MATNRIVDPVTYAFIDAGHLRPNFAEVIQRWCGKPLDMDVGSLQSLFSVRKVFYYDSIDDLPKQGELPEQTDERVRGQEAALREINAIPNTHVRYGSITGRDRRKRRQKEVDILIAVDMMNHAVRQNMDAAVLLTGDRDFTPLVETLVQLGLTVTVAGDHRFTSDHLREAADVYRPLALEQYTGLVQRSLKANVPRFPKFAPATLTARRSKPLAAGDVGKRHAEVRFVYDTNCFVVELSEQYSQRYTVVSSMPEFATVLLYLELQYSEVPWLAEFVSRVPADNREWHNFGAAAPGA